MGKPMGAGHPMAGLAARAEVMDGFGAASRYFNTFGGNPVSCAVGLTVLNVIRDEGLQANATRAGAHLRTALRALMAEHAVIGDVRGAGLFVGLELVRSRDDKAPATEAAAWLVDELRRRRVLISRAGPGGNVLKIRPPLPFSTANADQFVETLDAALKAMPPRLAG
jgi:4-aminobutyrate aminotransferase-like enzyme